MGKMMRFLMNNGRVVVALAFVVMLVYLLLTSEPG